MAEVDEINLELSPYIKNPTCSDQRFCLMMMLGSTCPRCRGDGALYYLAVVVLVLFSFPLTAPLFHLTLLAL